MRVQPPESTYWKPSILMAADMTGSGSIEWSECVVIDEDGEYKSSVDEDDSNDDEERDI
jgi:hypothetical protein